MIAAPRLQRVFVAPVTGKWGEEFGGASIEFRRAATGGVRTREGVELLGPVGYNLAWARFNSDGIDMMEVGGLILPRTGSDCLFNGLGGLRARGLVGLGEVDD